MLDVSVGSARQHQNLTVFPLVATGAADLPYDLLVDALAAGSTSIGEVGEGSVPMLGARNTGSRAVLILDGEQLIGARQNRMTNRSMLLPAGSVTEIPVYCMEQGRWHFRSHAMQSSPQHSPAKVRRRARETEARHAAAGVASSLSTLREAQGDVWKDVSETLHAMGAASPTHSLDAAYGASVQRMMEWLAAFPRQDDQVGLVAFVDGAPLGMDIIGAPRLYGRLHDRLLRGYIMDALEQLERPPATTPKSKGGQQDTGAAQRFLDVVRAAARVPAPTVGIGSYNVLNGAVIGGELLDDGRVAHLSAFPAQVERGRDGGSVEDASPLAPPSLRRRHR